MSKNPWITGWGGSSTSGQSSESKTENTGSRGQSENGDNDFGDSEEESDPVSHQPGSVDDATESKGQDQTVEPKLARLILSQYGEGTGSDKRLAFLNEGEGKDGTCVVMVYANGGEEPWRKISIEPLPEPGQELVLCSLAESELRQGCDGEMSGSSYNGDDALVVSCDDEITDSFGQVGYDPGASWTGEASPGVSSKDQWLVRCVSPDVEPQDRFELDDQWTAVQQEESETDARLRCGEGQSGLGGGSH